MIALARRLAALERNNPAARLAPAEPVEEQRAKARALLVAAFGEETIAAAEARDRADLDAAISRVVAGLPMTTPAERQVFARALVKAAMGRSP